MNENTHVAQYADDIAIRINTTLRKHTNERMVNHVQKLCQSELNKLIIYMKENGLELSGEKSCLILFNNGAAFSSVMFLAIRLVYSSVYQSSKCRRTKKRNSSCYHFTRLLFRMLLSLLQFHHRLLHIVNVNGTDIVKLTTTISSSTTTTPPPASTTATTTATNNSNKGHQRRKAEGGKRERKA